MVLHKTKYCFQSSWTFLKFSKLLCTQLRLIKTKGEISKEDAIAYRENSNSSQEVKLQSKVASEKKHPQTLDTDNQLR